MAEVRWSRTKRFVAPLVQTTNRWIDDRAPDLSAALAFYSVFSLAPMLVLVVTVVGLMTGRDAVVQSLRGQYVGLFGSQSEALFDALLDSSQRPSVGILATVLAVIGILFGATGLFTSLQDALNQIWRAPPRHKNGVLSFFWTRMLSLASVLGLGFLLMVSLVLSTAVSSLSTWLYGPALTWLYRFAELGASTASAAVVLALVFRFLPDAHVSWKDVWAGATVTAILFTLGKWGIGAYLGASAVASTYGAAGALAIVLLWVYYTSMVVLWGAEFTAVHAQWYGRFPDSRSAPPPPPPLFQSGGPETGP